MNPDPRGGRARRWAVLASVGLLALPACAPAADRSALVRRPLSSAAQAGWARLELDGTAQAARESLWLGDAQGNPVPVRWAGDEPPRERPLDLRQPRLGLDALGRPVAEFGVQDPGGPQGPSEQLHLTFQCQSGAAWAGRVEAARRQRGSGWIRVPQDPPPVLYDFGASGHHLELTLPWDAQDYRVTLVPVQGAPRFQAVSAAARQAAPDAPRTLRLEPRREALKTTQGEAWRLSLDGPERIIGLQVRLAPPAAPCAPHVLRDGDDAAPWSAGLVWNLPALGSVHEELRLTPLTVRALRLELPEGAHLEAAHLLVRREVLLFPAEAGKAYFLHAGGRAKTAPGSLEALPGAPGVALAALTLGAPEPDPQGLPLLRSTEERSRPWLPWVAGLAVAGLAVAAFRLLNGSRPDQP
jgi:hypothetical protein